MKVLGLGGAESIGSIFVKSRQHVQVINLDKLKYAGNPENLSDCQDDQRYQSRTLRPRPKRSEG